MENNKSLDEMTLSSELKGVIKQMKETMPVATIYPWPDMEVGDSILFQTEKGETLESIRARIDASISQYMKFTGKKFSSKRILKDNGVRVWRKA